MKKRIVSFLLVCCMLCSSVWFTSCRSAAKKVEDLIVSARNWDTYSAQFDWGVNIEDGNNQTISYIRNDYIMTIFDAQSEKPKITADGWYYCEESEKSIEEVIHNNGDCVYTYSNEIFNKVKKEDSERNYDFHLTIDKLLQVLPKELLKGHRFEKSEGASDRKLEIKEMDLTLFEEVFSEFIEYVYASIDGISDERTITRAWIYISEEEDQLSSYEMVFYFQTTVDGKPVIGSAFAYFGRRDQQKLILFPDGLGDDGFRCGTK